MLPAQDCLRVGAHGGGVNEVRCPPQWDWLLSASCAAPSASQFGGLGRSESSPSLKEAEEADSRGAGASDVKALSLKSLQTAIVSGKAATLRCCSATHDQSETLRLSKLNDVRAQAQALNPAVPKTLSIPVPQMPPASR